MPTMILNKKMATRELDGEYILIPVGDSALAFNGMMTTNAVGAFICEALQTPCTRDELIARLCEEFEVTPEIVAPDLDAFLESLRRVDLLDE